MQASIIEMPVDEAREAFKHYRKHIDRRHADPEDLALMRSYRELSLGRRVLDLQESFRLAGVDDQGRPKLAIARADWRHVELSLWSMSFANRDGWHGATIQFGEDILPRPRSGGRVEAVVPNIPPQFRPKPTMRCKYWILFEAEWGAVTSDPFLLKRINPNLYAIMAAWDLTPLEQAVLRGRL